MSDIVELLRTRNGSPNGFGLGPVCDRAADEIERLRADNFSLASWQCMFTDGSGLTGDESGRQICRKAQEVDRLRAEGVEAEKMCDSYAVENQRISDERDRLRELLRQCYGHWLRDDDPWELRAFLDRVQAALKEGS